MKAPLIVCLLPLAVGCQGAIEAVSPDAGDGVAPADGPPGPTELLTSVADHGVTWTFSAPVPVGRFVTGEYYVVGPATVTAITPPPEGGRNGSVVNVPPVQDKSGWDDRVESNRYDASLRASLPIGLLPGDSLASSVSLAVTGQVDNWLREGNGERSSSPVASISVLTCLAEPVPADTFRPSYVGHPSRLYRLADVNRALLPRLAPPSPIAADYLEMFATRLMRPWVDNLMYEFDAQTDYMAMYGRETARVAGIASLLLMLDLPADLRDAQERLLIGFLQHGIDLWGLVTAGYFGWYAHGGHGSGRKWFIVFAGLLFGDEAMASPTVTFPGLRMGEDMHTSTDAPWSPAWIGATAVYTGHMGIWDGQPVSSTPGWGPYEHLPPEQWEAQLGEGYRRCCTSLAWVGEALAARLMNAQGRWAHDAFFSYVDRWMDPTGDAAYTQTIFDRTGWDFRASWAAQGQAWDAFVEEMWAQYR